MTEEEIKTAIVAVNKFMYFSWNYTMVYSHWETPWGEKREGYIPAFLNGANWHCNLGCMIEKWDKACMNSRDSFTNIAYFYAELDKSNKIALLEWVMNNYNDEQKIY